MHDSLEYDSRTNSAPANIALSARGWSASIQVCVQKAIVRVAPRCAWLDGRGERILMNMVEIVLSILRFAGVYLLAYLG